MNVASNFSGVAGGGERATPETGDVRETHLRVSSFPRIDLTYYCFEDSGGLKGAATAKVAATDAFNSHSEQ